MMCPLSSQGQLVPSSRDSGPYWCPHGTLFLSSLVDLICPESWSVFPQVDKEEKRLS